MATRKKQIDRLSEIKQLSEKSIELLKEEYLVKPNNTIYTSITAFELILRDLKNFK